MGVKVADSKKNLQGGHGFSCLPSKVVGRIYQTKKDKSMAAFSFK
jgi:hypothetical protein